VKSLASWKVSLIEGPERVLYDIQNTLGQYYELQPGWIQKLQSQIKKHQTYQVHLNLIKSVQGPRKATLLTPFLLLLVTKTQLIITFLGELTENDTGFIIGIWPKKFQTILATDKQAILNLLYIIVEQPHLVQQVDLFF
jgi:hypothetical protein